MKQDEARLQGAAVEYLRTALPSRAIVFAVPNGGSRDKREAARLKWQGVLAGVPDVLVMLDGRTFGIEFKAPKGRLSTAQKDIADKFTANGIPWTVARSLDDVEAFLAGYQVQLGARLS
jgi:VRR-NUC domain